MNKVFVYGSLKNGYGNHHILNNSKFIGDAVTLEPDFSMISMGRFPGVIYGNKRIRGELYSVNQEVFSYLDRLEGNGHFYKREEIDLLLLDNPNGAKKYKAWMYILVNQKSHFGKGGHKENVLYDDYFTSETWDRSNVRV